MRAENFSQILDFRVHAIQHLPHGVDLDLTLFKSFQRKANGQMLGELHQHCFVRLADRGLRGQPGDRLF